MDSILHKIIFIFFQLEIVQSKLVAETCGTRPANHRSGAAVYDGVNSIYFLAGDTIGPQVYLDTVVQYDVNTYASKIVGRFPSGRDYGSAGSDQNGDIFYFGGARFEVNYVIPFHSIYKLNEENPNPDNVGNLSSAMYLMSSVSLGNSSVLLIGGVENGSRSDKIVRYNTSDNTLEVISRLSSPRSEASSVYDGKYVYIFGGREGRDEYWTTSIDKFDPIENTLERLDVTTNDGIWIKKASYIGENQTILIGSNRDTSITYFARFLHSIESIEELRVDNTDKKLGSTMSALFVPKNKQLYFHGFIESNMYFPDVYCIDFSDYIGVNCPSVGVHYLRHYPDCSKYYICNAGVAYPQQCPDGLYFDPELERCNIAEEVDCPVQSTCPPDGIVFLPVLGDCSKYIVCIFGDGTEEDCVDGAEFSPEEQNCVLDENYNCPYNKRL